MMKNGHVIFLNGTSSSGKTTLAKALQDKLPEPYMYVSIDNFFHLYPERFLHPTNRDEAMVLEHLTPAIVSGFHRSVAALAHAGNNVLVDHLLQDEGSLEECVEQWVGLDVLFAGVKCPLKVLEQREKERGNRTIGTARNQLGRVHAHGLYDIELDTAKLTVDECVTRIIALVQDKPKESAFQELANRFMIDETSISARAKAG
jgi:chloramphenicol 3-O phosphotransferase